MKKAIVTVDLGFGDSSKGAAVDWLCRDFNADLVVRYSGGAQAGHNVVLPTGEHHCFSQFGAGTFSGVPTLLGPDVIVDPIAFRRETDILWKTYRALNRSGYLPDHFTDPSCLVATPYHRAMNRIRESARGDQKHGSCGMGIGETRGYWLKYGRDALVMTDMRSARVTSEKLRLLRDRYIEEIWSSGLPVDDEYNFTAWNYNHIADELEEVSSYMRLSNDEVLKRSNTVVFEAAQGVMIDDVCGFHPYTTWSDVTTCKAEEMITDGVDVLRLGVIRAFHTRHGAGPLPTCDERLRAHVAEKHNVKHPWQGPMRMGWLDLRLLRYAVDVCGSTELDGVIVSHLDQLPDPCYYYDGNDHPLMTVHTCRVNMEHLGRMFEQQNIRIGDPGMVRCTRDELLKKIDEIVPVWAIATGPTRLDRKRVSL